MNAAVTYCKILTANTSIECFVCYSQRCVLTYKVKYFA